MLGVGDSPQGISPPLMLLPDTQITGEWVQSLTWEQTAHPSKELEDFVHLYWWKAGEKCYKWILRVLVQKDRNKVGLSHMY